MAAKNPRQAAADKAAAGAAKAEKMLKDMMKAGKVKDLNKTRDLISKKTGYYPNGYTN